ncbi:MAG: alpha/beta fold hydrolase [Candidatus Omnitrophica bacterium]|nr:alpha/beta fold hydrolase [Candidatus Omnitrophota bacterium]
MRERREPAWIDRKMYPFEPRYFKVPAGWMHYVDEGEGAPVVFVHGNPSWSFQFRDIITRLSKRYRCIAPDHIGFGLSDKPPGWTYLPEDQARNLEIFLESLDLSGITLVVGDWGGPIGLSYSINHPEKVSGLVITNTWMWPVGRDPYYALFSSFVGGPVGRWLVMEHNFFAGTMLRLMFGDKSKLTPEVHRHYTKPLARPSERKGSWVFPRSITASSPWLKDLWGKRAALLEKDILFAWGMKDIAFREKELDVWRRAFPRAETVRYEGTGHFVSEERSGLFARDIKGFIKG